METTFQQLSSQLGLSAILVFHADWTLGNCAIGIRAVEKHATTWDLVRGVAETLIVQCISGPMAGKIGGTAVSVPISARRQNAGKST